MHFCGECGKPGANRMCSGCHSAPYYCSIECLQESRNGPHGHRCARLPSNWNVHFVWCHEEPHKQLESICTSQKQVRFARDPATNTFTVVPDGEEPNGQLVDENPIYEIDITKRSLPSQFACDCAMFVQMVYHLATRPEDPVIRFGLRGCTPWLVMDALKESKRVRVGDEELGIGYFMPRWRGQRLLTLQHHTPGCGQWLLGPDKRDRYLGMSQHGAVRATLTEWGAQLAGAIGKSAAENYERGRRVGGYALEMVGGRLSAPRPDNWIHVRRPLVDKPPSICVAMFTAMRQLRCHCRNASQTVACPYCPSEAKYCSVECRDSDPSHATCARMPRNFPTCRWLALAPEAYLFEQSVDIKRDQETEEQYYRLEAPEGFVSLKVDSLMFIQLLRQAGEHPGALKSLEFRFGPLGDWAGVGNVYLPSHITIGNERLQVGLLVPRGMENNVLVDLHKTLRTIVQWVAGPDARGRYLGMSIVGPIRYSLSEWAAYLSTTLAFAGERQGTEPGKMGAVLQLLAVGLDSPDAWELRRHR